MGMEKMMHANAQNRRRDIASPAKNHQRLRNGNRRKLVLVSGATRLKGARCENHVYCALDLPPQTWVRKYDDREKVIEESFCNTDGSLVFRWIYLYDENGRRVEGNLHSAGGSLLKRCFYDGNNKVTSKSYGNETLAEAA